MQETFAFFGGLLVVPELLSLPVPDGSMYDFWYRGPSPLRGGQGQFYQLFTLQPMVLLASMAWHSGDDVFAWRAANGNRLKDGTDSARPFAAHANYPRDDVNMVAIYELVHSHHGDPADLEVLERSGRRDEPTPYLMGHKLALVGRPDRSSGGPRPADPHPRRARPRPATAAAVVVRSCGRSAASSRAVRLREPFGRPAFLALLAVLIPAVPAAAQARARHPNLLLNAQEIAELRAALESGAAPPHVAAAFEETRAGAPRGDAVETSFSPSIYTSEWRGTRASDAALVHALTGDLEYARAARRILLAWTQATVGGSSGHGVADTGFVGLAWAYDLIYWSGVLSADEQARIEDWLLRVAAPLGTAWHPNGPGPEYYQDRYGHAGYQNEFAWNDLLYGAVGFVTGDEERIAWATAQQWPYEDYGHHPELAGVNARSLREYVRGAIYRGSTHVVEQDTTAIVGGQTIVPNFRGATVPDGSMYDFWHRGPSPAAGGTGQFYQLFTLQPMALLASMAWHAGDDVFSWRAPNGNRLKDGTDFARAFAAHTDHPDGNNPMVFLYGLLYSHHGDPADLALLESSGLRDLPSEHFMRRKFLLVGYAPRHARRLGAIQGITFRAGPPIAAQEARVFLAAAGSGITQTSAAPTFAFRGLPGGSYRVAVELPPGVSTVEHSTCPPGETGECHVDWQEGTTAVVEVPDGGFVDLWWRFR